MTKWYIEKQLGIAYWYRKCKSNSHVLVNETNEQRLCPKRASITFNWPLSRGGWPCWSENIGFVPRAWSWRSWGQKESLQSLETQYGRHVKKTYRFYGGIIIITCSQKGIRFKFLPVSFTSVLHFCAVWSSILAACQLKTKKSKT